MPVRQPAIQASQLPATQTAAQPDIKLRQRQASVIKASIQPSSQASSRLASHPKTLTKRALFQLQKVCVFAKQFLKRSHLRPHLRLCATPSYGWLKIRCPEAENQARLQNWGWLIAGLSVILAGWLAVASAELVCQENAGIFDWLAI